MPHDNYQQFVVLFFLGLGLVVAAGANLALRKAGPPRRAFASFSCVGLTLLACWGFEHNPALLEPLAVLLSGCIAPMWLAGTMRGASALAATAAWLKHPSAVWWAGGVAGAAVVSFAAVRWQEHDDVAVGQDMYEVMSLEQIENGFQSSHHPAPVIATTDLGTEIFLQEVSEPRSEEDQRRIEDEWFRRDRARDLLIRRGPADDRSNCFGWVFTGGMYWIPGSQFEIILQENGYREMPRPRPGDLAIYRKNAQIMHVAVVRYTARNQPVLVEGKWGRGGVYLHAVDQSMYGDGFVYMRSPRFGHLLAGISNLEPLAKVDDHSE